MNGERSPVRNGSPTDPRSFCGRVPWPLIVDLRDGEEVAACYLVQESRRAESRNNQPYLKLLLGDRTGSIDAFIWEETERWEAVCVVEAVVGVRARVATFQDRLQLRVSEIHSLEAAPEDLEYLLPTSPRPRREMEAELERMVASVAEPGLRSLLNRCLGRSSELGQAYRSHPAAKRNHHAYVGGLLEHSLSVAAACDRAVEHYRAQGVPLDRDLLIAAALLHDIGKIRELKSVPGAGYTTEGQLLGHIVVGMQLVSEQAERVPNLQGERLLLLQHLIASHQGRPEWESPRVPQIREALILHYLDDLDAKMNQVGGLLARVAPGEWTEYARSLGRSFYRPPYEPFAAGARGEEGIDTDSYDLFED